MDVLIMAARKSAKKGPAKAPPGGWTTFRLYGPDGEELGDLARDEGKTIADLYRELLAPLVKARLIERTEQKLKKMKGA